MFDMGDFLKAAGGGMNLGNVMDTSAGVAPVIGGSLTEQFFGKSGGILAPSSGDMHIDQALTNISLAFMQSADGFVARGAFRSVPVQQRGNVYWTYPRGSFNRNQMQRRAPGTESAGANYEVDTAKYYCEVYALHVDVADQIRDNADSAINIDRDVTTFLTMKSMLLEEIDWRDKFFGGTGFDATPTSGTWEFVADGVASGSQSASLTFIADADNNVVQWSDTPAAGELGPIEQVRLAIQTVQQRTGFRPNVMVMGRQVFDVLLDNPDIIDRIDRGQTPGGPAMTNRQNLAALFELDDIMVMDAIVNTAAVGVADNHAFIGGKNALLLYRPASAGLMTPAPGYTFLWSGFSGANAGGMRIKNIRSELIESDRIEVQSAFEHNQVSKELGFYFNGIVA